MKFFHNGPVGRFIAVALAVLIHLVFSIGMFFLGQFLGSIVLGDYAWGPTALGFFLASIMFFGAMYAFIYHEYTKKDVKAYEQKHGDGSFEKATRELQWIVAGFELSSLLYRAYKTFPNYAGAFITVALGILMLRFAFILGKVIHAIANRPVSEDFKDMQREVDKDIVKDGLAESDNMSYAQKRRLRNGDVTVIDEVRRGRDKEAESRRRIEERERENDELAESAVRKMLSYPGAEQPSRNGAHPYRGIDDGLAGGGF